MSKNKSNWFRKIQLGFLTIATALSLTACGGSSHSESASAYDVGVNSYDSFSSSKGMSFGASTNAVSQLNVSYEALYKAETEQELPEAVPETKADTEDVRSDRKLIRSVEMRFELDDFRNLQGTVNTISKTVNGLGGYCENSNVDFGTYSAYGNVVARIPKDKVDGFISEVQQLGMKTTFVNDNLSDVTAQYVDIESRLKVKETQKEKYQQYLEQATTIEDLLYIEDKLNELIEEIESSKAQLNTMDKQVDYTRVDISIHSNTADAGTFGIKFREGLDEAGKNFGDSFIDLLLMLSEATIPIAFSLFILYVFIRVIILAIKKGTYNFRTFNSNHVSGNYPPNFYMENNLDTANNAKKQNKFSSFIKNKNNTKVEQDANKDTAFSPENKEEKGD